MDALYADNFPSSPNCNPHSIPDPYSAGCGWTEGFATYIADWVYNDPNYRWPSGAVLNEETPTWGSGGWSNGDWPEGRVTGALWDIRDSADEASLERNLD